MSLTARIRLVCPQEGDGKAFDDSFESGGGFRWCEVTYETAVVGSGRLCHLTSVKRKGVEIDLAHIERLNAPKEIDEAIQAKFKDYASTVQQQPIAKRTKKKAVEPKPDPSQFEMPDL